MTSASARSPPGAEIAPSATSAAQTPAATIPATVSRTTESISATRSMKRCGGRRRASGGGPCSSSGPQGGRSPRRRDLTGSACLLVGHAVADSEDGLQALRCPRVVLDLAAQVLDMGVDRALVRLERDALDGREQL